MGNDHKRIESQTPVAAELEESHTMKVDESGPSNSEGQLDKAAQVYELCSML